MFGNTPNNLPEWQANPEIFALGRQPHRADLTRYSTYGEAVNGGRWQGNRYFFLNGEWSFKHVNSPDKIPVGFWNPNADLTDFGVIPVPAQWQLFGYDYAQYVNVQYPWEFKEDVMPPYAPSKFNPVGCYVKKFILPENFAGMRTVLRFEGVDNAFYLYVNGIETGFSQNSFCPAEFDITDKLVTGENTVALAVYHYSDSSWLEDQDFFRLSGIFRDVYLYCTPKYYIVDLTARTDYTDGQGSLSLSGQTMGEADVRLLASDGSALFEQHVAAGEWSLSESFDVKPWSAEKPNLYTLVVALSDGSEFTSLRLGFRRIEVIEGVCYLNGAKLKFTGVDRHEFDASTGRAITPQIMLSDIATLKRSNINAVRTSHYPNHPLWYDLCDKYGIYLIDENNMESHGTWYDPDRSKHVPGNNPIWKPALIDRVESVWQRDKNHPSVILWSLGNESGGGSVIHDMYLHLKSKADGRLVHYEGGQYFTPPYESSDVHSSMYSNFDSCRDRIKKAGKDGKPFMLCEYSHAMGNSCGDIDRYVEMFYSADGFMGGFIWDWVDQALWKTAPDGTRYLGFGGDFGDKLNDGQFCGNGLLTADRQITPKLMQVRKSYGKAVFSSSNLKKGEMNVTNRFLFTDLNEFEIKVEYLLADGITAQNIGGQSFGVNCAPGETAEFRLSLPSFKNGELLINLTLCTKEACDWTPAGYALSSGQFVMGSRSKLPAPAKAPAPEVEMTFGNIYVKGQDWLVRVSTRHARLESIVSGGRELLAEPVYLNFWRAPTDNDCGYQMQRTSAVWRNPCSARGSVYTTAFTGLKKHSDRVEISMDQTVFVYPKTTAEVTMTFYGSGRIVFSYSINIPHGNPDIPKIGMQFVLTPGLSDVKWLGRGPQDNYCDRCSGAALGLWSKPIDNMYFRYLNPQESGNAIEVREAELSGDYTLKVLGNPEFELNVGRYKPTELETADHWHELPKTEKTVLQVNLISQGVGGDDSWSENARPHEPYRVKPGRYKHSFVLEIK